MDIILTIVCGTVITIGLGLWYVISRARKKQEIMREQAIERLRIERQLARTRVRAAPTKPVPQTGPSGYSIPQRKASYATKPTQSVQSQNDDGDLITTMVMLDALNRPVTKTESNYEETRPSTSYTSSYSSSSSDDDSSNRNSSSSSYRSSYSSYSSDSSYSSSSSDSSYSSSSDSSSSSWD